MRYHSRDLAIDPATRLFRALGDPTRLRIVALLAHDDLCVGHFAQALALPQPNISNHLAILREAGVVTSRREKSWVHYHLAEPEDAHCRRQLKTLVRGFAEDPLLRADVAQLLRTVGPAAAR